MKKNLFYYLLAVICSVSLFTSCSDDDDDNSWKQIPETEISGENAVLKVNGSESTGSVQMKVSNGSEAVLTLKGIVPGYGDIPVNVNLQKQSDESYNFEGIAGLTTPPSMIRSTEKLPVIMNVTTKGNITTNGVITVDVTTLLSEEAQGGLTGSWKLLKSPAMNEQGGLASAPLFLIWSAKDVSKPNMEVGANIINAFGSMALYNLLNQVTFHENGNITAKYWSEISLESIMGGMDDEGNFIATHDAWLDSPKNLAFWYVKGGQLYIVPNIEAILKQVSQDNGSDIAGSTGDLTAILGQLAQYNIDVTALLPLITEWMSTGIPVKFSSPDGTLKVYVDKDMVAPFMTALLPALEVLQVELDKIIADPTNEYSFLIRMAMGMLGIEKLTDIKTIWEQNTDDFELSLNFIK